MTLFIEQAIQFQNYRYRFSGSCPNWSGADQGRNGEKFCAEVRQSGVRKTSGTQMKGN